MPDTIAVALITGACGLLCAVITGVISSIATGKSTGKTIAVAQAVTDTKIDELTREVREHNGFARRMPVVEEQIKVINHRIADLEQERRDGKNN